MRSFDAIWRTVAVGLGIAVLPDRAIRPLLRSIGLRRIELADEHRLLFAIRDLVML